MAASSNFNTNHDDENSLGILSLDDLKVFGEQSSVSSKNPSSTRQTNVSQKLNVERIKAAELLARADASGNDRTTDWVKQHQFVFSNPEDELSDLVTDNTIDLNTSSTIESNTKISFQPGEMTGRSTLSKPSGCACVVNSSACSRNDATASRGTQAKFASPRLSVREILAASFSEKARKLAEQLPMGPSAPCPSERTASISDISFPKTRSSVSFVGGDGFSEQHSNVQNISDADFVPNECAASLLINDEIEWAKQYGTIPEKLVSEEAKRKLKKPRDSLTTDIDELLRNSVLVRDVTADFSVGKFFKARSENLLNIADLNEALGTKPLPPAAPSVDAGTYTKSQTSESDRDSYLLSMSAIAEALRNMAIDGDACKDKFEYLYNKCNMPRLTLTRADQVSCDTLQYDEDENKENTDPTITEDSHEKSRTRSITESFLNCTNLKAARSSLNAQRIPLSPLMDLTAIPPENTDDCDEDNDADIDEFPSTPIVTNKRRVRRTKSPNYDIARDQGEHGYSTTIDATPGPMNKLLAGVANAANTKSLSSTRIDGCEAIEPSLCSLDLASTSDINRTPSIAKTSDIVRPSKSPSSCPSSPATLDYTASPERKPNLSSESLRKLAASPVISEAPSNVSRKTTGATVRKTNSAITIGRSLSRLTNCSEFSHRDGKAIPLKVTKLQLSWGSTRLHKDTRRTLKVKNAGEKRLIVRIGIYGPGFQLVNTEGNSLTLQSQECRSIIINFCPTVTGVAVGMLSFYSPSGVNNPSISFLDIPLYAYGGNAGVTVHGLQQGPVGDCYLPMGEISQLIHGSLDAELTINNKGPLTAFACVSIESVAMMKPRVGEAFEVSPKHVIIPPQKRATLRIRFCPHREDIKKIMKKGSQVSTLANMRIICGDEATRQRMRYLVRDMVPEERNKLATNMLDCLWEKIPNEFEISELSTIKEPSDFLSDLASTLRMHNVALTLNRDFDETSEASSIFFPDADETVVFRTICYGNSRSPSPTPTQTYSNQLEAVDELREDASVQSPINQRH